MMRTALFTYQLLCRTLTYTAVDKPIMVQASASGDSMRYIVIMVRVPHGTDIDVERIVITVSTAEAMQTYRGADLWHPIGNDGQAPIFWTVQIPLYQADDPTIPADLVISQNQKVFRRNEVL